MDKEVLKLIEKSKKELDKKSQRVELLKRNEMFLNELNGIFKRFGKEFFKVKKISKKKLVKISADNILLKLDYPKVKIKPIIPHKKPESEIDYVQVRFLAEVYGYTEEDLYYDYDYFEPEKDSFFKCNNLDVIYGKEPDDIRQIIWNKRKVLNKYKEKWEELCKRWHIDSAWNGNLNNLSKFQMALIEISINEKDIYQPINIRISAWTSKEDLEKRWNEVQEIQKEMGDKEEMSSNLVRDLYWYDLKKKGKSYGEIAKLWIDNLPEDIDSFIASTVQKRFKIFEGVPISEFLAEIRSGDPQIQKVIDDFNQTKESYTNVSLLKDKTKKAIRRLKKRIKKLDLPSNSTSKLYRFPVNGEK